MKSPRPARRPLSRGVRTAPKAPVAPVAEPIGPSGLLDTLLRGPIAPWLNAALIVLAACVIYFNSLECPFVYDDLVDVSGNESIRQLFPPWDIFLAHARGRTSLVTRPVVNLSLAINYATTQFHPESTLHYHLTNLAIHIFAGLALLEIVRRTLRMGPLRERFAAAAAPLSLVVAMLWTVHPLQTESVTYVTQRYESLMGLFYLLTLYGFIRSVESPNRDLWSAVSVTACLLAAGCKEVAVSAPIIVLLYDRAFVSGSFAESLRRRWLLYAGYFASWVLLIVLSAGSGGRSRWAGYSLPIPWHKYLLNQSGVILHYLRLSVFPGPLVLDYSWPVGDINGTIVLQTIAIVALGLATLGALIYRPRWGFLGAWFFLILAPTSSVLPLADLCVEHRMYLPLAAVLTAIVLGLYVLGRWVAGRADLSEKAQFAGLGLAAVLAVGFGYLTFQRNKDYRTDIALWQDTANKAPCSSRARNNLATLICEKGHIEEGIKLYREAIAMNEYYADAQSSLAEALRRTALTVADAKARAALNDEAIEHAFMAVKSDPESPAAQNNLGLLLCERERYDEAIEHCWLALEYNPKFAEAHLNLGMTFGRLAMDTSVQQRQAFFETFRSPDNRMAKEAADRQWLGLSERLKLLANRLAVVATDPQLRMFLQSLELDEYQTSLQLKPNFVQAYNNIGVVLHRQGRVREALPYLVKLVELDPNNVRILFVLATELATHPDPTLRNAQAAVAYASKAVDLTRGQDPLLLDCLGEACAESGNFEAAIAWANRACDLATAQHNDPMAAMIRDRIKLYRAGQPFRTQR